MGVLNNQEGVRSGKNTNWGFAYFFSDRFPLGSSGLVRRSVERRFAGYATNVVGPDWKFSCSKVLKKKIGKIVWAIGVAWRRTIRRKCMLGSKVLLVCGPTVWGQ